MENATWVIAIFTIVLSVATLAYAGISYLAKRKKKTKKN